MDELGGNLQAATVATAVGVAGGLFLLGRRLPAGRNSAAAAEASGPAVVTEIRVRSGRASA